MLDYCKSNLLELKLLLNNISHRNYNAKLSFLSNASIGQHIRHILEFYDSLHSSKSLCVVNYDNRKRNLQLETNVDFATSQLDKIITSLSENFPSKPLLLKGNYTDENNNQTSIVTNFERELAYCLEHSIHHQALIKVGLIELKLEHIINPNFGIAPATIRYNKTKCAQ